MMTTADCSKRVDDVFQALQEARDEVDGGWCNTRNDSPSRPFVKGVMAEQGGIDFQWQE
jgi:hypothetical protein